MAMTLTQLAELLGGVASGPGEIELTGPGELTAARPGQVVVAYDAAAARLGEASEAAAMIVPAGVEVSKPSIAVADPRAALARLLVAFAPPPPPPGGVHPSAVIDPTATLGADPTIGPHAVVGPGAVLGDRVRLGANVVVGAGCWLGADVTLHPNVTLYPGVRLGDRVIVHAGAVLGADGYGYRLVDGRHEKIPQLGRLEIGDDVEIGANTTIDRGTLGPTVIGSGTKIDNQVQIGHNCRLGQHVLLVSQVGLAGSVEVGDYVAMGGQVGVADHRKIGHAAVLGAQCGVMRDVPPRQVMLGSPAQQQVQFFRELAALRRLPDLAKRLRRLEGPGAEDATRDDA